jgi:DNA-binding transcriptional MocR family regulator
MDYFKMTKAELESERQNLHKEYNAFERMGLNLDMSRGKPSPEQLDLSNAMISITDIKDDTGADARNYGNLEGLPEARRFFSELLGVSPAETLVGGNSSLDLMYQMIALGWQFGFKDSPNPWKDCGKLKFLCPVPGYDRHFRVTEIFGFEMLPVPMTAHGPDMAIIEELVRDDAVKGIWCTPVYSNPDGYTYSNDTVKRLAGMKTAAPDFRIFWDNAYGVHHLYDKRETCLNILSECRAAGNDNRPLIFCSTSKITFAGAGVSAIGASSANIDCITKFFFSMTIGFDKLNQLRHVRFLKAEGGIAEHMKKHAKILAPKFKVVNDTFCEDLGRFGEIARWTQPNGGYFISLYTMNGCAKRTVALCKQAGVTLTGAGAAYPCGVDPEDRHIRIAPTYPSVSELETAVKLLCVAVRLATIEKLINQQN